MAVGSVLVGVVLILLAVISWLGNRSMPAEFGAAASPAAQYTAGPATVSAGGGVAGSLGDGDSRTQADAAPVPTAPPPGATADAADDDSAVATPAESAAPAPAPPVLAAGAGEEPVTLAVPTLGVQAAVEHVVVTNGELGVPRDVSHVGWWSAGSRPGAAEGSVVIDGHVDDVDQGPGAFFALGQLTHGAAVSVTTSSGAVLNYQVSGLRIYDKSQELPPDLFASTGPPRLVLITCGGEFDQASLRYVNNVVVFADPVA